MYLEKDIVGIAKRENNNKRKYLVVNRLQGKHVPVKPSYALHMFDELAEILKEEYKKEKLLLIGFAETATAIGASVATSIGCQYMQTTREIIDGVQYLYFSESHSHATEQKLVKDDVDKIIDDIDRIVFVEDEVTTGNTIMKIIAILNDVYGNDKVKFSVASILNGMNSEAREEYRSHNTNLHYLVKTDHSKYEEIALDYPVDGACFAYKEDQNKLDYEEYIFQDYLNARRRISSGLYLDACKKLWNHINATCVDAAAEKVLVLGTEEFMYPAMFVAKQLETLHREVKYHATTRSPITVSNEPDYPLHTRYELRSLYEKERITYIYDLAQYDICYIITDAKKSDDNSGLNSLIHAVNLAGTCKIKLIRWCE